MADSTSDTKTAVNIIRHLMSEEGYRANPYLDPNKTQANIGYGHTFYYFKPHEIEASRKAKNRDAYLLSIIPKSEYKDWDKKKAETVLIADYTHHRNLAQAWLDKNGMGDDARLVDQVGLLFFGATGGKFMKSYGAQKALKNKDADALSLAASHWGRSADGRVMPGLVARRNAERNYYMGNDLPVKKEAAKTPVRDQTIASRGETITTPSTRYKTPDDAKTLESSGDLSLDFDLFSDPESASAFMEDHLGKEGKNRANEAVWKALNGSIKPMPEGFDAVQWASEYKAPSSLLARDWRVEATERGDYREQPAESLESFQDRARKTEQEFLARARQGQAPVAEAPTPDDFLELFRKNE